LLDLDDLQRACPANDPDRQAELRRLELRLDQELAALESWVRVRAIGPAIADLRARAEDIRALEVRRSATRLRELTPAQQAVFAEISDELQRNGFEVEPFGTRSVAVKVSPAGVDATQVEHMLHELLEQLAREEQKMNLDTIRTRIAASIACHAAIKVNMPLEQNKMEWLLAELAKADFPFSCPHGRPVVLRYSMKDIQKAFKRI